MFSHNTLIIRNEEFFFARAEEQSVEGRQPRGHRQRMGSVEYYKPFNLAIV
jgi:hypothetical protein